MAKLDLTVAQKAIADELDNAIEQALGEGVSSGGSTVMDAEASYNTMKAADKTILKEVLKRNLLPLLAKLPAAPPVGIDFSIIVSGYTLTFTDGILTDATPVPPM